MDKMIELAKIAANIDWTEVEKLQAKNPVMAFTSVCKQVVQAVRAAGLDVSDEDIADAAEAAYDDRF